MRMRQLIALVMAVACLCAFRTAPGGVNLGVAENVSVSITTETRHYKMNDNSASTVVIDSGTDATNATASANTSVMSAAGKIGTALDFNGSTHYVNCGDYDFTPPFSISLWYYSDTDNDTKQQLIAKTLSGTNYPSLDFYHNDGGVGTVKFTIFTSNAPGTDNSIECNGVTANTWYHVVATMDSSNAMKLYLNGVYQGNYNSAGAPWVSSDNTFIGGQDGGAPPHNPFFGLIDDVRFYSNKCLVQADVTALYNAGNGTESPL